MSKFIYLYGVGETSNSNILSNACYLKCEIPDADIDCRSGFFPSVLHSYIMYAKDIGLLVTDVVYENFDTEMDRQLLYAQLPYSLWPLFYVNNSEIFTGVGGKGVALWSKPSPQQPGMVYDTSIMLDTRLAYYYRERSPSNLYAPDLTVAQLSANPVPSPNNAVNAQGPWFLELKIPDAVDKGANSSTYSIVKHYNELVVWDTLVDMSRNVGLNQGKVFNGMKGATGKVLKGVVDRRYAYDALVPNWNAAWGVKPNWYDNMRITMNNYNISASLFWYDSGDPDAPTTKLHLLGTADNIKGVIKAGHAETRLLLTLDALNNMERPGGQIWKDDVCKFYEFDPSDVNFAAIVSVLAKNLVLISSLKPCYMCVGEVDSTGNGFIMTIDRKPVEMWASFAGSRIYDKLAKVIYFDIDRPIIYPSTIDVIVHIGDDSHYQWTLALAPWSEWTAAVQEALAGDYNNPIGPRIVEPAGECLKTGYAYIRYQNSAYALLTDSNYYLKEYRWLTSSVAYNAETDGSL